MFHWRKEIVRLDIPASQVYHLERSLSAVQVALPGLPAQEATAYLCLFAAEKGLRVALVLHLHTSQCLAFYLHDRADAPQQEAARLIEEGHNFAESLGFMLSDVDYRKLGQQQRASLWGALPLKNGVESSAAASADVSGSVAEKLPDTRFSRPAATPTFGEPLFQHPPAPLPPSADEAVVELSEAAPSAPPSPVAADDVVTQSLRVGAAEVVEGLPEEPALSAREAAEPAETGPLNAPVSTLAMHNTLPDRGPTIRVRAPKQPLRAEELTARRQKLLESLGRFLASL